MTIRLEHIVNVIPAVLAVSLVAGVVIVNYRSGVDLVGTASTGKQITSILTFCLAFYFASIAVFVLGKLFLILGWLSPEQLSWTHVLTFNTVVGLLAAFTVFFGANGSVFKMKTPDLLELPALGVLSLAMNATSTPSGRAWQKRTAERKVYIDAIERGDVEKLREVPRELIDGEFNSKVYSLVVHAAYKKNTEMIKILVGRGASLDRQSEVLRHAVRVSDLPIIELLVSYGAEPILPEHQDQPSDVMYLPIGDAAQLKKWDVFQFLLREGVKRDSEKFREYLVEAGRFRRDEEMVRQARLK